MTHSGGRWDRERRSVDDVRAEFLIREVGFTESMASIVRGEFAAVRDKALRRYPCSSCGLEATCGLAYEPSNEGRTIDECAREERA